MYVYVYIYIYYVIMYMYMCIYIYICVCVCVSIDIYIYGMLSSQPSKTLHIKSSKKYSNRLQRPLQTYVTEECT